MPDLRSCPITELPVLNSNYYPETEDWIYEIQNEDSVVKVRITADFDKWENDSEYVNNKYLIAGLLLNGKIPTFENFSYVKLTLNSAKSLLRDGNLPNTPQSKYDNLLQKFHSLQAFDGQTMDLQSHYRRSEFYKRLYFRSRSEYIFYVRSLEQAGYITAKYAVNETPHMISLTYAGLNRIVSLSKEGTQSKNCFIAMSFGPDMGPIRQAIKDACTDTGYIPVVVDEIHYDSDATINDAIVANLKKSRFCIADFTEQKKGVYFESGFALGQGKQVIYSCRNDSFNESHFDTNHFPHILYDTPEDLKTKLIDKIGAWIR